MRTSRLRRFVALGAAALALSGCHVVPAPLLSSGGPAYSLPGAPTIADLAYGARGDQLLDLFVPSAAEFPGPRPVIVWLHAGGWAAGSRKDPAPVALREVGRGYAVASVEYGLAPEQRFPTPVHDVKLAIRWLRLHASEYGLDGSALFLAGYSAGAQLAALAAVTPGELIPPDLPPELAGVDDSVRGVVVIAGGVDFVALAHSQNPWARAAAADYLGCVDAGLASALLCPPGVWEAATVANHVRASAPPVFFVHGAHDPLFPPGEHVVPLAQRWEAATGRAEAVWGQVAPDSGHGITADAINLPELDAFLDGVYLGEIR